MEQEADIDRLPIDLLAHIFVFFTSFTDLAQASSVCKRWKQGVKESLARRKNLSFAGWEMDDESTARLVRHAYNLRELDIPRSRWGCQITDNGLFKISMAKCVSKLTSISLWGMTGITDKGVVQLAKSKEVNCSNFDLFCFSLKIIITDIPRSLQHLNVGGTFITDESLFAIATSCPKLETIVLWSCRQVTEAGLLVLVDKCRNLKSMNVWGTRVPVNCLTNLVILRPDVQIKVEVFVV